MTRQAGLPEMTPWFGGRQEVAVRCIRQQGDARRSSPNGILGDVREIRRVAILSGCYQEACVLEIFCEANTQDVSLNLNALVRTFCVGPRSA